MADYPQGTKIQPGQPGTLLMGADKAGNAQPLPIQDFDVGNDTGLLTNRSMALLLRELRLLRKALCVATSQAFVEDTEPFSPGA